MFNELSGLTQPTASTLSHRDQSPKNATMNRKLIRR
jgi:hypothetical protein